MARLSFISVSIISISTQYMSRFHTRAAVAVSLLTVLVLLSSCGSTYINVPVTRPAEINTGKFKRAAVLGFKNTSALTNEGDQLEFMLSERLIETQRFEVLDKIGLNRLMKGGNTNSATPQNDVMLISGVINDYEYTEQMLEGKPYQNKEGKTFVDYQRVGTVRFGVSFQVSQASDAKIIGSKSLRRQVESRQQATNAKPATIIVRNMVEQARVEIIADFLKRIVPYRETVKVEFYSDKKMPELASGIDAAESGNWEIAVMTFEGATQKYATMNREKSDREKLAIAWYDLGLAYQYTYRFADAERAFNQAIALDNDSHYKTALQNCRAMEAEQRRLQEQGG